MKALRGLFVFGVAVLLWFAGPARAQVGSMGDAVKKGAGDAVMQEMMKGTGTGEEAAPAEEPAEPEAAAPAEEPAVDVPEAEEEAADVEAEQDAADAEAEQDAADAEAEEDAADVPEAADAPTGEPSPETDAPSAPAEKSIIDRFGEKVLD